MLFVSPTFAQKVEKIITESGAHYITTAIDYPITGTYLLNGEAEPLAQLNPDGTGIFQQADLSKINMDWGIECFENGAPKYQKGFNYASTHFGIKTKRNQMQIGRMCTSPSIFKKRKCSF